MASYNCTELTVLRIQLYSRIDHLVLILVIIDSNHLTHTVIVELMLANCMEMTVSSIINYFGTD